MTSNPLHVAALFGRSSIVRGLIAAGADPNAADERGARPLHWATALRGERCRRVVGVLLRRAADPFALDATGRTPEDWARTRGNRTALRTIEQHFSIASARRLAHAGFTLVELLCILGLACALMTGVFGFYSHTRQANALLETESTVSAIVTATEHSYAAARDYASLTTASALSEGWLPSDGRGPSGPVNGWGNPISLGHADGARANGAMTLNQDIPASECAQFVARLGSDFNRVTVAGSVVSPADVDRVATACSGGDPVSVELDRWK